VPVSVLSLCKPIKDVVNSGLELTTPLTIVRGQTPSSMGESFFFSCTRHISMYLCPGTVILSFCPTGYYFYLCPWPLRQRRAMVTTVQQLGHTCHEWSPETTCDLQRRWDMHAPWVSGPQRRRVIYRADGTRTHCRVCPHVRARKTPSTPLHVQCFHSLLYTLNSCTFSQFAIYL